jgi:hypothetical protein
VFRVLQVTPVKGGGEYRIWSNTKSIIMEGREYRFSQVGQTTLTVPASPNGQQFIVSRP